MYNRENDKKLVQDYINGMSWAELMKKYDCSVTTIHDVLIRNKVERTRDDNRKWSKEKDKLFTEMYLANCTYPEISAAFNIKGNTVTHHVHRLNLPMRGSGRNSTCINKFTDNTVESNYWLGYIFADGHITNTSRNGIVSLYSEKQYVVIKFKEWFGDSVHLYCKDYILKDGTVKKMHQANICSNRISLWFTENLGIESKKHHNLNPNIELNWNIIRGYFDGDGSMSPERFLSIESCSKIWLERIQNYMLSFGIQSTVKLSYRDCYGLFVYELENLEKILKYMYENPYYCHEYKHTNLVNRVAAMRQRKSGELLEAV